jgi:hypothetical protein
MLDVNLKVPLSTITNTFNRYAKRATTAPEKKYLLELTEAVGTAISTSISPEHKGFDTEEFARACGVSADWAKVAA